MNRSHLFSVLCLVAVGLPANEWLSNDGRMSVTIPNLDRFSQTESAPPLTVIWASNDETIKLAVAEMTFPREFKLNRSAAEEGLAEEMNGKIIESSVRWIGRHEVFDMTCHGNAFGEDVFITQSVVILNGKGFKLMAIGINKNVSDDPDVVEFMSSWKILEDESSDDEVESRPVDISNESLFDYFSKKIGGISALVLIICFAVIVISRFARRR